MPLQSRVFQLAKDPEHPEQSQDAYGIDAAQGIAAVADGVASSIFARQWAGILARAVAADPPDPSDMDAFRRWLAERRQEWTQQIDTTGLAWFQKAKLPLGAFSTLLWIRLLPVGPQQPSMFGGYRLQGFAIGDSCLFHTRRAELVRTFPVESAAQFEQNPVVLGSVDLNRDQIMKFAALDASCYPDDVLVLCTDAIGEWALRQQESGNSPQWDRFWDLTEEQWQGEIARLRAQQQMRYDDATLLMLRVAEEGARVAPPQETPAPAEVVEPSPHPAPSYEQRPEPAAETQPTPPEEEDWKEKFRLAGREFIEGIELVSEQALRGWKKWAEKAAQKYREKFKK